MTALVLGSNGQVGSHLRELLPEAIFWGRSDADLANPADIEAAICRSAPSLVVNCAAYTAVDKAEQEPELAWRVNAESPAAIARAATVLKIPVVHISTDYVFDGHSKRPYRECDGTNPINVYGRTKLAGDLAISTLCDQHWILRTSWVFSEHGSNFVKTMLRLAGERDRLTIVADQRGRPSYAGDIAVVIAKLVERIQEGATAPGTYHLGGGPEITWFEFASHIFREAKLRGLIDKSPELVPIPTSAYPTPAARPLNSVLEPNEEFLEQIGADMDWKRGLATMLQSMDRRGGFNR
jgi:dTDP-4-dehydrorhamnose reductase